MSLATQMRNLQGKAAAFRQDLFGAKEDDTPVTIDYNDGEFRDVDAYYSPIRYRQFTDDSGGFLNIRSAVVRVLKSSISFTPEIDKLVRIKEGENEFVLRIDEIAGTHPASVEWILACKEQN